MLLLLTIARTASSLASACFLFNKMHICKQKILSQTDFNLYPSAYNSGISSWWWSKQVRLKKGDNIRRIKHDSFLKWDRNSWNFQNINFSGYISIQMITKHQSYSKRAMLRCITSLRYRVFFRWYSCKTFFYVSLIKH